MYNIFGNLNEYREAICSYYMMLNILEFTDIIVEGKEEIFREKELALDIPLHFLIEDHETSRRAYRLLINDANAIKSFWRDLKVEDTAVKENWPLWVQHLKYHLTKMGAYGVRGYIPHEDLISDLD